MQSFPFLIKKEKKKAIDFIITIFLRIRLPSITVCIALYQYSMSVCVICMHTYGCTSIHRHVCRGLSPAVRGESQYSQSEQGSSKEREKWSNLDLKHQPYSLVNATNSNHVASKINTDVAKPSWTLRSFRGLSLEDFLWIMREIWWKSCKLSCACPNSALTMQASSSSGLWGIIQAYCRDFQDRLLKSLCLQGRNQIHTDSVLCWFFCLCLQEPWAFPAVSHWWLSNRLFGKEIAGMCSCIHSWS